MYRSVARKLMAVVTTFALAMMLVPIVPGGVQQAEAATYPSASEVYVSGKSIAESTSGHATYDASTGTLTITKQVNGISVKSSRTNLDLNIVVDGDVHVYARTKHEYLLPKAYGISNDTGGNISIRLTASSTLHVNIVVSDEAAPPQVSLTEFGGIYCRGKVSLTGEEGSKLNLYARADWYKVTDGKSEMQSLGNLPTTGIWANGGLSIDGALSGKIQVQNHGAAATPHYCTSAVRVASGGQVSIGGTGDWEFDTSSCWAKSNDDPAQYNALFYTNLSTLNPTIADTVGKITFRKTERDNSYYVLSGSGTPPWHLSFSNLPEINYHTLSVGSHEQSAEYRRDSREVIDTTTIKLAELPALGTRASLTADNTVLDAGQSTPRYSVKFGQSHWWYKQPGKDYWITLGNTQDIPTDATAVRVEFSLEAAEGYRLSNATNVKVQLPNGTIRDTTERNYMRPADNPSTGSFYIDLQLSDIAEQHPIERVKMWGLSSPYMGRQVWTESGTTNTTSSSALINNNYYIRYEWAIGDQLTSNGYQYNQYWTLANDDGTDTNNRVPSGSQFQAGKKYFWHGVLHAKTGWKFTYDTLRDLDDGIAGPKWVSSDGKVMEVTKSFQCPTKSINEVKVIDQTEPVAGETAAIDATVPDDANYSVDTARSHWVRGVLNASSYYTDANTPFTGTFKANEFYTLVMFIKPDKANGCGFPFTNDNQLIWDSDKATINGAGYEYGYYFAEDSTDGRGSLMIFRVFWCNNPDAITHVNVQQTMPVAGQQSVSDAVSFTPDVTLDAIGAEQKAQWGAYGFDVTRISDGATSVWIGNLFNEDESFNYAALMPMFENSGSGVNRTYTLSAQARATGGKTFARNEAGATVKVFVGGVPAIVQVTSDDPDVATIRLPYTMPWANSDYLKLFVPCGVQLQVELSDGSWSPWTPSEANYNNTGFDCYDQATAGKRFRVYPTYKWQAPAGEEFYKWYSSTGDVEFENNVREEYNYFTMPDHDVTVDILTQKEGTLPTDLEDVTISGYTASDGWNSPNDYSYTTFNGHDQWREAVLVDTRGTSETDDDYTLVKGVDYKVSYEPAMGPNKGEYEVTYTGIPGPGNEGGYEGTRITNYSIFERAIEDCDVTLNTTHVEDPVNPGDDPIWWEYYTGEEIKPSVTVKLGDYTLTEGTDYNLKYYWNTDVGSASVEITTAGLDGNFHSWTACHFEIRGHDINDATVAAIPDETFDFNYHRPDLEITYAGSTLQENTDYTVTYTDNIDAGTATATIEGLKSTGWTGTREVTFKINPLDLDDESIIWYGDHERGYTGSAITTSEVWGEYNARSINLGTEIQCDSSDYSDNVYPGVATMTVRPLSSNFTGSHDVHFDIQVALNSSYMSYSGVEPSYPYTGSQITTPEPVVKIGDKTLTKDKDYKLSYGENIEAGGATGSVTVEPYDTDHYYNSKTLYFNISQADISAATVAPIPAQRYDAETPSAPEPVLTFNGTDLVKGTDFNIVGYGDSYPAVGDSYVRIEGIGNFKGTRDIPFKITDKFIEEATVEPIADQTYTGGALKPAFAVTSIGGTPLTAGTDYTAAYTDNTNVGTATVTITGAGEYLGEQTVTFNIAPADIAGAEIAAIADQTYAGSALKPAPVLKFNGAKLDEGTDYTLAYSNNVQAGTAAITITGKGNFTGTATASFKIVEPPAPVPAAADPASGASDLAPSPATQLGDDGTPLGAGAPAQAAEAAILASVSEEGPAGTKFSLMQAKLFKVTKSSITLKWAKVRGAAGYSVYGNACGKKNRYFKIKSVKSTKFTEKKLKKGTYYKYLIVAFDRGGKVLTASKTIHAATKGGKVGNDGKVKLSKKKATLKRGKSLKLKAKVSPQSKKLKVKRHRKTAWESSNPAVAKVNAKGKVTALKKGKAYIWAYAQDGVAAKCKITVK